MKTTYQYDTYFTYQQLTDHLNHFASTYPSFCSLSSLAKTTQQHDVWVMTITDSATGSDKDKPAYYLDANIHAGEVTGSMTALYLIDYLLTNHQEPELASLLKTTTFYIIPRVSPDGAETYLTTPYGLRSVNRLYPLADNSDDIFVAEDLDGDGVIRMMRVASPFGSWKVSADHPKMMTRRLPNDTEGTFYHVYPEGKRTTETLDDITTFKNLWGFDFNRNFPFGWYIEKRQPGAADYPLYHPETKALADFVLSHDNIGFATALHTTGGVLLYPPGTHSEKDGLPKDMAMFRQLNSLSIPITGYKTSNVFDAFLTDKVNYSSGAFDDWCYETQGIPSLTIELWDLMNRSGVDPESTRQQRDPEVIEQETLKAYQWLDENAPGYYQDWQPYNHPQLGLVEIGGVDYKYTFQNPPHQFLPQEVEKMSLFIVENAKMLPKLIIDKVSYEAVGPDTYSITALIGNVGFMNTNLTEKAIEIEKLWPISITLNNADDYLTNQTLTLSALEGYGNVPTYYQSGNITTQSHQQQYYIAKWIVKTSDISALVITASSKKSGITSYQLKAL